MYLNEYAIVSYTCDTSVIACMSWRMILDIRYRSPFKHEISDWCAYINTKVIIESLTIELLMK